MVVEEYKVIKEAQVDNNYSKLVPEVFLARTHRHNLKHNHKVVFSANHKHLNLANNNHNRHQWEEAYFRIRHNNNNNNNQQMLWDYFINKQVQLNLLQVVEDYLVNQDNSNSNLQVEIYLDKHLSNQLE